MQDQLAEVYSILGMKEHALARLDAALQQAQADNQRLRTELAAVKGAHQAQEPPNATQPDTP